MEMEYQRALEGSGWAGGLGGVTRGQPCHCWVGKWGGAAGLGDAGEGPAETSQAQEGESAE